MVETKNGSLFDAPSGLICHQVNCRGVMGSGVAKIFRYMYPEAYNEYVQVCAKNVPPDILGTCLITNNTVCMFAQEDYSSNRHVRSTEYWAFRDCCIYIVSYLRKNNMRDTIINMPYRIGCGLGGGDWDRIYNILTEEFEDFHVILWKLED